MDLDKRLHPKLSIIMPCYNSRKELRIMLDSIVENDFKDWELIVVDDGSEPETLEVLTEYAKDERISILHRGDRKPKGAQTCRNIGLDKSKGEFIIFFDNDDLIEPFCLRQRVEALESQKDLDFMVFPSSVLIGEKVYRDYPRYLFGYKVYNDDIAHFASRELPFVVWNNIYRTESLRKNGIVWDTNLRSLQDADFNLKTLLAGMKYDYARSKPDIAYRISHNTSSVSHKIISEEHMRSNLYALSRFYELVQERFGKKYNAKLYQGLMFLFTKVFTDGIDYSYAKSMHAIIKEHDSFRAMVFAFQLNLAKFLSLFIPVKRARQIATLPYLLGQASHRRKLHSRIMKIQTDLVKNYD